MTSKTLTWVVVMSLALVARTAAAQDKQAIKKIEDLNRIAMEDYDLTDFESAKKKLTDALVLAKKSKLDKHKVAAMTNLNLGIVYGAGLKDPDNAKLYFIAAVEIDPSIQIPVAYKDPSLQRMLDEAKAMVGGGPGGGGGGGAVASDPVETVVGLEHSEITEAEGGKPIRVSVKVGADLKAKQVILYYRPQRAEDFTPVPMKPAGGAAYEADIPAEATSGDYVHYYIEARNEKAKVVATKGSAGSPNVIDVLRARGGGGDDDEENLDDENPLEAIGRGGGGGGGRRGGGDDDGGGRTTIRKKARRSAHTWFANVAVGTGFGFVTGKTEQQKQPVTCCIAPAPFHVMPEIGFWLSPKLMLSACARIGFPVGANLQGHASAAPAGFLRLTYALGRGDGEGLLLHGDVGGGFIRHTIKLDMPPPGQPGDTDTYVTGPLFIGGGAVFARTLGGPLKFVADANLALGIPVIDSIGGGDGRPAIEPHFAVNMDINLGLMFAF